MTEGSEAYYLPTDTGIESNEKIKRDMTKNDLINKYINRIKTDYPEDDKLHIDLIQFANEYRELFSIPIVVESGDMVSRKEIVDKIKKSKA